MSITDELREYVDQKDGWGMTHTHAKAIAAIADRIDERYSVKVERLEKYRAAVCAMLKEYVKLPVDADGVPIRVGDSVALGDGTFEVRRLELYDKDSWDVLDRFGGPFSPLNLRHVKSDTWERIIEDAMNAYLDDDSTAEHSKEELADRCRRLAGETE